MNLSILDVQIKIKRIRNGKVVEETMNIPAFTAADEGKMLAISGGVLAWVEPEKVQGAVLLNQGKGNAGKILMVGADGNVTTCDVLDGVKLKDRADGKTHSLYVSNGKLTMDNA